MKFKFEMNEYSNIFEILPNFNDSNLRRKLLIIRIDFFSNSMLI